MTLHPQFGRSLQASIGESRAARVLEALSSQPSTAIRLNPSKLKHCPFDGAKPVPWSPYGYILDSRPVFTLDPLFHAGCYYVQDSSAMYAGHIFRQLPLEEGCAVLDLCAAPGGKTTDLAASLRERLGDRFTLIANEVMRSRYGVLKSNVETWGDPRVGTLSRDPSAFGDSPLFDIILADVPCSGEGMFRKDERAVEEWSPETVEFCAARSKRILSAIWPTLRPGGYLIYSTCTLNQKENDLTAEWIADSLGAEILRFPAPEPVVETRCGALLLPGFVPGEGQWVAVLRKNGDESLPARSNLFALLGASAPSTEGSSYPGWEVDRESALKYLHGDALALPADAPVGLITIKYEGQALGAAKNLGKRCNNLYPKAKRIRMDIK